MRIVIAILLTSFSLSFFSACKKGDNDPFLSLNSRKARMHGDWDISSFEYNERNTSPDGDYTDVTRSYDAGIITQTSVQYFEQTGSTFSETSIVVVDQVKLTFDKAGTWNREFNTTEMWTDIQDMGGGTTNYDTIITVKQIIESGDWSFLGKLKGEYKNKERIIMNVLTSSETQQISSYFSTVTSLDTMTTMNIGDQSIDISNYYSGENNTIIEIDRLKKKEMVFIEKRRNSGSLTIIPYTGITTMSDDDTFYSESIFTLIRI